MGKAGIYCLLALLAPMTMLAGAINPEGTRHINQIAAIPSGGQVHQGSLQRAANWGDNDSSRIATPSPQKMPAEVGLEAYSLQPEHDFGFYGSGFGSGEMVETLLENADDPPSPRSGLLLAKSHTNQGGNMAGRAYIPLIPAGDYPLVFVGLQSKTLVILNLNIRGFKPWVTLSDYAPSPHTTIGFRGQDFAPWEPVLVYLNQRSGQPIAHLHADSTGGFDNEQAWQVPDGTEENTLIFVGTNSGTVATTTYTPLPPMPPQPTPSFLERSGQAHVGSPHRHSPRYFSIPLLVTPSAIGVSEANAASFLQDPMMLALLFLGLWSILCLLLILPLIVPRRRKQRSLKQSRGEYSSPPESRVENHNETSHFVAAPPVPAPRPLPLNQDVEPEQPANFCPWCGLRNVTRSSHCTDCKRELPQLPARVTSIGQPPIVLMTPQQSPKPVTALVSRASDLGMVQRQLPPALGMQAGAKSDRGRRRAEQENEDDFLVVTGTRRARGEIHPFGLFVVADGMGGHNDGHRASRLTIETIFKDLIPILVREDFPGEGLPALLQGAIQNANWRLYSQNEQEHSNLGATVTAALVSGREATICNVGDSRVYLRSLQSPVHRVTVDHSIVESLVVAGIIQREDVYSHPKRNLIFRSVGQKQRVQIDTFRQPIIQGDQLLLCSDGLWEMLRDYEIEQTLRQFRDMNQASEKLVELANAHGGLDNITAILVEILEEVDVTSRPVIQRIDTNSVSVDQAQRGLTLF